MSNMQVFHEEIYDEAGAGYSVILRSVGRVSPRVGDHGRTVASWEWRCTDCDLSYPAAGFIGEQAVARRTAMDHVRATTPPDLTEQLSPGTRALLAQKFVPEES